MNTRLTNLLFSLLISITVLGCTSAGNTTSEPNDQGIYQAIANNPERYLSFSYFPIDRSGQVIETSALMTTFLDHGIEGAAFMRYMLADGPGEARRARVRVVPVVESRAPVPVIVKFDSNLNFDQDVYQSLYKYTPNQGYTHDELKRTQPVTMLVRPNETKQGDLVDFGDINLYEAGTTWIGDVEIKKEITSISTDNVRIARPE